MLVWISDIDYSNCLVNIYAIVAISESSLKDSWYISLMGDKDDIQISNEERLRILSILEEHIGIYKSKGK